MQLTKGEVDEVIFKPIDVLGAIVLCIVDL